MFLRNNDVEHSKTADGAVAVSWLGFILSHLAEANQILQFILLILSIFSALYAIRYYHRNTPK